MNSLRVRASSLTRSLRLGLISSQPIQLNGCLARKQPMLPVGRTLSSGCEAPEADFARRHIGPTDVEIGYMLDYCKFKTMEEFIQNVVPSKILLNRSLKLKEAKSETDTLKELERIMEKNEVWRTYIGQGYYGTVTPAPILRNLFENPGWYTSYTPYQPEISQGRLEALLNFQTVVSELTGLELANASLLDEGTAAAEAMALAHRGLGTKLKVESLSSENLEPLLNSGRFAGCLVQYPDTNGDLSLEKVKRVALLNRKNKMTSVMATDLLALTLAQPPGKLGFDIAIGSAQRFGVPMGFGGPHAAFFATHSEFARLIPGRLVGVSKDSSGGQALRLTLQTREQHIRRQRATSNICTAQALLASMSSMYAVYHGPKGLKKIATRVHRNTLYLCEALKLAGHQICNQGAVFDTLKVKPVGGSDGIREIKRRASEKQINLRYFPGDEHVGISLDETVAQVDVEDLLQVFNAKPPGNTAPDTSDQRILGNTSIQRSDSWLSQTVFNVYHSETSLMRYMKRLENKDVSLTHSMIPLGSCTMKLNAATSLTPCSWPKVNRLHPFAPEDQARGYNELIGQLEEDLAEITGYDYVCVAPNSGAQGEYAGLRAIAGYLNWAGQATRNTCLIPTSAHGTNPASAQMAGFQVHPVRTSPSGAIDMAHLKEQVDRFKSELACMMLTYPSTFGVFDEEVVDTVELIHRNGGQVYLDGANMNAQVGLCRPGDYGTDVCHLNLHKTFSIPHGGGGPGVGPVCVKAHLAPFLPQHAWRSTCLHAAELTGCSGQPNGGGAVCSAPFGSTSLLPIPWAYLRMLGPQGLRKSSEVALLNANYMLKRLKDHYIIKFVNAAGLCAHEFIMDCSEFQKFGIEVTDIAKRLIDYGFHSPTMSWPVASSLMLEPTESESLEECDRLCDALIQIRQEIDKVVNGDWDPKINPLKLAPHTIEVVASDIWDRPYTRLEAAFPTQVMGSQSGTPDKARSSPSPFDLRSSKPSRIPTRSNENADGLQSQRSNREADRQA